MAEVKTYVDDNRQPVEDREFRKFVPDKDGDVAVNVVGKNIEMLLEAILDALDITVGESHFAQAQTVTTPNVLQTLISETVPNGKLRSLARAVVTCRQEGVANIKVDGVIVGTMRTGASSPNGVFEWTPKYPVGAETEIKVEFTARQGSPIVDVEGYLQAVDKNI